jgi:hypothetical protein
MMIMEEVAEEQLVATEEAPRLRKEGDGSDDTKEAIEIKIKDRTSPASAQRPRTRSWSWWQRSQLEKKG